MIADVTASTTARVVLVDGYPPLITIPPLFTPVSHKTPLTIQATAANISQGCLLKWESLPAVGYETISLENVSPHFNNYSMELFKNKFKFSNS